jgi:hypothetical protein
VDSFQRREVDIAVIVVGTTASSGPGFATTYGRLNVIFSRHRCGLIVVGDINVIKDSKHTIKRRGKGKGTIVIGSHLAKVGMLLNICRLFRENGRILRLDLQDEKGKDMGKDKDEDK